MAAYCPKCDTRLSYWSKRKKPFPCPSCGTKLRIHFAERSHTGPFIFWVIFGSILDAFGLIGVLLDGLLGLSIFSSIYHTDAEVHFADETEAARAREMQIETTKTIRNTNKERLHFAEAGDPVSQYKLGKAYIEGDGVKQDYSEALKWLLIAAEQGYADAQSTVGRMYFMGEGTKRNNEEAFFWYSIAAKSGKPKEWAEAMKRYLNSGQVSAIEKVVAEWQPSRKK